MVYVYGVSGALFATISGFTLIYATSSPPRAPAGLAAAGKRLWRSVLGGYQLTPGEREVLTALCHATDQLARLNAELVGAPLTVKGSRGQQVPNPLLHEVRMHNKSIETLQRALCFPQPGEKVGSYRNPNTKSSVDARWSRAKTACEDAEGSCGGVMARAIDQGRGWVWPPGLAEFDPAEWDCQEAFHLARARACPDRAVKLAEIQMASQRPWLDEGPVEQFAGVAFVLPPDAG